MYHLKKKGLNTVGLCLLLGSTTLQANEPTERFDVDMYGSIRAQAEIVRSDREDLLNSYEGFRDSYSRIGLKAHYLINDEITLMGQVEIPLDVANFKIQGPFEQNKRDGDPGDYDDIIYDSLRIGKVGVETKNFGSLYFGQMWIPYYNAISYPVDVFSTYYAGYATFSNFRLNKTIAYYSPAMNGFTFSLAWSKENGQAKENGESDDRYQATISYAWDQTHIALGLDNQGGMYDSKILAVALSHTIKDVAGGDIYLAAKYEQFKSDKQSAYGEDGSSSKNFLVTYTKDTLTYKAMIADTDNYGEGVYHLGIDYQVRSDLKLFIEYYHEDQTAAITTKRGGVSDTVWSSGGGNVYALGFRYDF